MKFSSLQDVIDELPDEIKNDYENGQADIDFISTAHYFKYLALYDRDGNFDMLCGNAPTSYYDYAQKKYR